jgi:hypothetical protein
VGDSTWHHLCDRHICTNSRLMGSWPHYHLGFFCHHSLEEAASSVGHHLGALSIRDTIALLVDR